MGYLNQPQQAQPYRSENTFQGVQMDTPAEATPNTVLSAAGNMHLLRQQGGELVLQTEPGMEQAFPIPPDHWLHGWAERNGILYLLLMATNADGSGPELDPAGQPTGRGELGTWPSPEYAYQSAALDSELVTSGNLSARYRPLRVYYGDHEGQRPTDMRSAFFNLALDAPSELELQSSYDGTLNIIINDGGRNPALLINSGFAVEPPEEGAYDDYGRYRLILREGQAQTNRYTRADFTSRLRLHPRGGSLAKAWITDVTDGGRLPGGEYRYYFTYADADGNETAIFAEAGAVPVFDADTPADAHGTREGERTTRRVVLALSNLDATFGFVRVRYVRRSGEPSPVAQAYALTQRLTITTAGTVDFSHTGYEEQTGISAAQLAATAGSVSAFTTMCQAGNRLLLAGIEQPGVEDADLFAFARSLRLGHQQVSLPGVPGVDAGSEAGQGLYLPLALGAFTGQAGNLNPYTDPRAVWSQGGHLNPLNATYRRGYPSGESVAFGVRFILDDYSLSDTYPMTGGDNLAGALHYDNVGSAVLPAIFEPDGWSQTFGFGTYNELGVYRFPETTAPGMRPLLEAGSNAVNILAARVRVGEVPDAVRTRAVGLQFMRAARVPNRLVQGYALPTLRSLVNPPNNDVFDQHHNDMRSTLAGATANLKVLPTVRGILETVVKNYGIDPARYNTGRTRLGALPFAFNRITKVGVDTFQLHDPLRMALYAPDALLRPAAWLGRLNEQSIKVKTVGVVYAKNAVGYANFDTSVGTSWSLHKTTHHALSPNQPLHAGRSFWTLGKQFVVNRGKFGSAEKFLLGKHSNDQKYLVNLAWTPYVGLQLNTVNLDEAGVIGGGGGLNTGFWNSNGLSQGPTPTAYLVNVYDKGGILPLSALRQVYQPESLTYVPITQRLSWDELLGQRDADSQVPLYGGDTYVHPMYRRLTYTLLPGERKESGFDPHVGQVLSLVCETDAHPAARSDEPVGTGTESGESYLPRLGAGQGQFDAYRTDAYYMAGESARYNGGYTPESAGSPALVQAAPRVEGVPFRAQHFRARVWASAAGVDGSFANGYRFLPPLGFRDYERSLGEITRLLPIGDQAVLVVHTHGLELLAINERVLTGQGAAGPVYAEGLDFLPPKGKILSRTLGCQHPQGVCVSPEGVYGADASKGVVWFWAFGAEKPARLSDAAMGALLRPLLAAYLGGSVRLGTRDLRLVYDSTRGDVIVSAYQIQGAGAFMATTNAVYSEPLKQWMGEHPYYRGQALVNVPARGLFSLPLAGQSVPGAGGYSFWRHRALPASGGNAQRAGGYGRAHDCWAEFVVLGSGVDTTKILDNLVLVSEGRDPDQLSVRTAEQPAALEQRLIGPPADITRRNAQRREGHTWITVKGAAKRRGRWIRVRLGWLADPLEPNATPGRPPQDAGRLFKASSIVRDSFT